MASTTDHAYTVEQQIAIAAVRRACVLTASVFNKLVKQETPTKDDLSPVKGASYRSSALAGVGTITFTVGDYYAQA